MPSQAPSTRPALHRLLCWTRRAAIGLAALLAIAACFGAAAQAWLDARTPTRFPLPGRWVKVDGRRMHLNCTGTGAPTVILEAGLAGASMDWAAVQPGIAAFTRVCSYDRAGHGASDPAPQPRDARAIATELHVLLAASGEPGPYLLVAHSIGALDARVYRGLYPSEVAGMVLVDPSHPLQEQARASLITPVQAARQKRQLDIFLALVPAATRLGLIRVLLSTFKPSPYDRIPPATQASEEAYKARTQATLAELHEYVAFPESAEEAIAAGPFGDLPLTVITAARAGMPGSTVSPQEARFHQLWMETLQPQIAHLSTQGKQIVATESAHEVPEFQPGIIVSTVFQMTTTLRPSNP